MIESCLRTTVTKGLRHILSVGRQSWLRKHVFGVLIVKVLVKQFWLNMRDAAEWKLLITLFVHFLAFQTVADLS